MKKIILSAMLAASAAAWAQTAVKVEDAWVRATLSPTGTAAYMKLTARSDAQLVEVRSPAADIAEVHEMRMDKDVMKMRAVPSLALPAGQTVELKPGGYHVMLMDLKAPLKAGEQLPLVLVFETRDGKREQFELKAPVRALGAAATGQGTAAGHGMGTGSRH